MKHQKDHGQTLRDLVESALEQSLSRGETGRVVHGSLTGGSPSEPSATSPSDSAQRGAVAVGEVLDTHHPHLPGRVLVRWLELDGKEVERWLQRERHLSLLKGDRVLVTLPVGWNQWIVTGALGRESREPAVDVENARELCLGPGETLRVLSHEGQALLTLTQGPMALYFNWVTATSSSRWRARYASRPTRSSSRQARGASTFVPTAIR